MIWIDGREAEAFRVGGLSLRWSRQNAGVSLRRTSTEWDGKIERLIRGKGREELPGVASSLAAALCEVSRGRRQWDTVAAHAAWQLFTCLGNLSTAFGCNLAAGSNLSLRIGGRVSQKDATDHEIPWPPSRVDDIVGGDPGKISKPPAIHGDLGQNRRPHHSPNPKGPKPAMSKHGVDRAACVVGLWNRYPILSGLQCRLTAVTERPTMVCISLGSNGRQSPEIAFQTYCRVVECRVLSLSNLRP